MISFGRQGGLFVLAAGLLLATPAMAQFNAFKDPTTAGKSSGAVSGPDLKAGVDKIDAGKVTTGSTAYVVALFRNSGTSDVTVTGINLYPSSTVSAEVSLNKCAEQPLPPEAECAVTIAVTGLQIGSWRIEVLLDHDGRTRLATAAITGMTENAPGTDADKVKPDLEPTPDVLDFGNASGGLPSVKSVLLRNRTSQKIDIKDIRLDMPAQAGFDFKSSCPQTLQTGESCNVVVTWTPLSKGDSQAVLVAAHSGTSAMTQVEVKGKFEPGATASAEIFPEASPDAGLLISDKKEINFGGDVKGASAITSSLVNTGSNPVTLQTIRLSGSDSGLSIARSGCQVGTVLQPTAACALTVNWVPSREGSVIDDLQIQHTGARGVLVMPIRGTATEAVSRETLALRQGGDGGGAVSVTPVLDGYVVTSHSTSRAVINGPVGSLVVRDGEDVVISGVKWTVTIVSTGVILSSEEDEIMLVFDRSLKPNVKASSSSSSSTSSSTTTDSTAAETTTTGENP